MPDFSIEQRHHDLGNTFICGVDEAGRGPWAGPVVAAAAMPDPARMPATLIDAIDDSKKLSAAKRALLFAQFDGCVRFGIGQADVTEIESVNILQATLLAMKRAVDNLACPIDLALIDGNHAPDLGDVKTTCLIKGDGRSLSIAAASIAAKVTRDKIMADLAKHYPGYGWERNAGYGTQEHKRALARLGVTPVHRKNFAPIRNILRSNTP